MFMKWIELKDRWIYWKVKVWEMVDASTKWAGKIKIEQFYIIYVILVLLNIKNNPSIIINAWHKDSSRCQCDSHEEWVLPITGSFTESWWAFQPIVQLYNFAKYHMNMLIWIYEYDCQLMPLLQFNKTKICPAFAFGHEMGMISLLNDAPFLNNDYAVRILNWGQSMSYSNSRSSHRYSIYCFLNHPLGMSIQCTGCLVQ